MSNIKIHEHMGKGYKLSLACTLIWRTDVLRDITLNHTKIHKKPINGYSMTAHMKVSILRYIGPVMS